MKERCNRQEGEKGRWLVMLLVCFMMSSLAQAQTRAQIDSLNAVLQTDIHDTTRINIILILCRAYRIVHQDSLDHVLNLIDRGMVMAKHQGSSSLESKLLGERAETFYFKGELEASVETYEEALKQATDSFARMLFLSRQADPLTDMGLYDRALANLLSTVEYYESLDSVVHLSTVYNQLGSTYHKNGDINKALEYYKKSASIRFTDDALFRAQSFGNIVYYENEVLHQFCEHSSRVYFYPIKHQPLCTMKISWC